MPWPPRLAAPAFLCLFASSRSVPATEMRPALRCGCCKLPSLGHICPVTSGEFITEFLLLARLERANEFDLVGIHFFVLLIRRQRPVASEVSTQIQLDVDLF